MLDKVHEHIINELQQSSRTDTIFVLTAVVFNLIVLAVNSGIAENANAQDYKPTRDFILIIFILLTLVVNFISIKALMTGKNTRSKLLDGLISMYKDNSVDKYYDQSLLLNYNKRYFSFTAVILAIAATAVIVPLALRFM